jgi:plastocyanin
MKRIVTFIAFVLVAALLASQAAPAAQPGPAQASGAKTVDIDHFKFQPQTLEIAKGTKVVFSNSSGTAHTATDKGVFDSGLIKPGKSFAVRFGQKGTFRYHCEIHPFMKGKVVVG